MGAALPELLVECIERQLTFAVFRDIGSAIQLFVQNDPHVQPTTLSDQFHLDESFLIVPFTGNGPPCSIIPDLRWSSNGGVGHARTSLDACKTGALGNEPHRTVLPESGYIRAIEHAKRQIDHKELEKIVLARAANIHIDRRQAAKAFLLAERAYPNAFVHLFHTPTTGTWIGASPERLFASNDGMVSIDAIAATRLSENAPATAEAWSEKERNEQQMVVDSIKRALAKVGLMIAGEGQRNVILAGPVAHLKSVITASLTQDQLPELIDALHPTAALCGTPRDIALSSIAALEPHPRRLYTGVIGHWQRDAPCTIHVNIRCMQLFQDHSQAYIGCGITAGSDPRSEWEESENKLNTWRSIAQNITR